MPRYLITVLIEEDPGVSSNLSKSEEWAAAWVTAPDRKSAYLEAMKFLNDGETRSVFTTGSGSAK